MEHTEEIPGPVDTISARVKELRRRKGLTAAELGERLTRQGVAWDRSIVANLENGRRRSVTVTELLALALVLDVSPLHLLVPLDEGDYRVTPELAQPTDRVREWIRGGGGLPGTDMRIYGTETPRAEFEAAMAAARARSERFREAGADVREVPAHRVPRWIGDVRESAGDDDGEHQEETKR